MLDSSINSQRIKPVEKDHQRLLEPVNPIWLNLPPYIYGPRSIDPLVAQYELKNFDHCFFRCLPSAIEEIRAISTTMSYSAIGSHSQSGPTDETADVSFELEVHETVLLGFQFVCHLLTAAAKTKFSLWRFAAALLMGTLSSAQMKLPVLDSHIKRFVSTREASLSLKKVKRR